MRIRVKTEGHQYFSEQVGDVLAWTMTVEQFDQKPMQVPAVVLNVGEKIVLLPLKTATRWTEVSIMRKQPLLDMAYDHVSRLGPIKTSQLLESMRDAGADVAGFDKLNNLAVMLSKSGLFKADRRAGWTIKEKAPCQQS